jgi:hypothetical protein
MDCRRCVVTRSRHWTNKNRRDVVTRPRFNGTRSEERCDPSSTHTRSRKDVVIAFDLTHPSEGRCDAPSTDAHTRCRKVAVTRLRPQRLCRGDVTPARSRISRLKTGYSASDVVRVGKKGKQEMWCNHIVLKLKTSHTTHGRCSTSRTCSEKGYVLQRPRTLYLAT